MNEYHKQCSICMKSITEDKCKYHRGRVYCSPCYLKRHNYGFWGMKDKMDKSLAYLLKRMKGG